ncbi:MAG TPA: 50S ribosomal protein L24 [Candidatus Polarisedimenticolia bacterium]|nr:50S ribosomal protein L24 [Candidatus Polarisedimenticolia bacterium]
MATYVHQRPVRVPEIRKGDTVVVLTGRDTGKRGKVERVIRRTASAGNLRSTFRRGTPKSGLAVVVEGINIARRHTKPRQSQGRSDRMPKIQQGGIMDIAQPMDVSKVMLVCPKCDRPTRVGHTTLENGRRIRVCKHCGEALEVSGS